MTTLRAGFGRADITPQPGSVLVGYGRRTEGAAGVHDRLWARALVVDPGDGALALVSCDLLFVFADTVDAIRRAVERRTGLPRDRVFVAATHTHGGPSDTVPVNWPVPLADLVADAVEGACRASRPARVGSGFGALHGYSINRRWIDKPIDPAVVVLRVDDEDGNLLGLVTVFGCHPVVLGPDNRLVTADWPGQAMTMLESQLGRDVTCLFFQGGAGDVNPLVSGVRSRFARGCAIVAMGNLGVYYGSAGDPDAWHIGDRTGGTFEEADELGGALAGEVLHVARTLRTSNGGRVWAERVVIEAAADPGDAAGRPPLPLAFSWPAGWGPGHLPAEIMIAGIGDAVLVGQPGEVFSETAVALRQHLRALGYATPALVSCANGSLLYLPEPAAFAEGGYEVNWAVGLGICPQFQPRVRQAIEPLLVRHAPRPAHPSPSPGRT